VIAHCAGEPVSARQFLADVRHLAARLPSGTHVLNVCADRYHFAVGLAACLVSRKISLMPGTRTPEAIRQLAASTPDALCLTDDERCDIDLERVHYRRGPASAATWSMPRLDPAQTAAILYTSGSTGAPVPHAKTWGSLVHCVQSGAALLGLAGGAPFAIVGTVPAQHMYGFESTVLLPLLNGGSFAAERPFYPADVCAALAAAPRPRVLVTTPVHLRTLLAAGLDLPADLIVSATAPLSRELARDVEARFAAPLLEIYGSTETGQIATRRTRDTDVWTLWPGVQLVCRAGDTFAAGGHVGRPTALADVIEITGPDTFRLHGRTADLVNIAGKRSSFGFLNHQLNAIDGVSDGAFFQPEAAPPDGAVTRLAAVAVAPALSAAAITAELRLRIDPVFLPRPLLLVDALPRNATGKLPRDSLLAVLDRHNLERQDLERQDLERQDPPPGGV